MGGQGGWPTKSGGWEAGERVRVPDEWRERYSLGDRQSAHRIGRTVRRICPPDRLSSRSDLLGYVIAEQEILSDDEDNDSC